MKQQQNSLGLCYRYPCLHGEPQPTPTSSTGPQDSGRFLDPLWALWGQLRLRSLPTPTCMCPQRLQKRVHCRFRDILQVLGLPVIVRFNPQFCAVASRDFCSYSLVSQPLWLTFDLSPTSACGLPSGVCRDVCPRIARLN